MKRNAAVGSLVALLLALILLVPAAYAQAPTYDMTGTWNYQLTDGWIDCPGESPPQDPGTVTIIQTGNTFTVNNQGEIDNGTIVGNRYQMFRATLKSGGGADTEAIVWNLDSSTVGEGSIAVVRGRPDRTCSWLVDLHFQRQGACTPTDTLMCLQNGRYSVSVTWKNEQGQAGIGHAIPSTDDSGLFWFFSPNNMELLIKVLDGCSINNRYWVFFAATTDQEFTVTVSDTKTAEVVVYTNPLKNPADAVTDTDAFATCP